MNLNQFVEENNVVVVDFAAPAWCVPCQRLAPHFEAVSEKIEGVKFLSVDIDTADSDLVELFHVQGVPTVLAFKDGELLGTVEGRTAPKLVSEISSL